MLCNTELRIPKKWSKYLHDIVKESTNPEILNEEDLISWHTSVELSHRSGTLKVMEDVRPYQFVRCIAVLVPNNPLCRNILKAYVKYFASTFLFDDKVENSLGQRFTKSATLSKCCLKRLPSDFLNSQPRLK